MYIPIGSGTYEYEYRGTLRWIIWNTKDVSNINNCEKCHFCNYLVQILPRLFCNTQKTSQREWYNEFLRISCLASTIINSTPTLIHLNPHPLLLNFETNSSYRYHFILNILVPWSKDCVWIICLIPTLSHLMYTKSPWLIDHDKVQCGISESAVINWGLSHIWTVGPYRTSWASLSSADNGIKVPLGGVPWGIRNIICKAHKVLGRGLSIAPETGATLKNVLLLTSSWSKSHNSVNTQIHMNFDFTVNSLTKFSLYFYHERIRGFCAQTHVGLV